MHIRNTVFLLPFAIAVAVAFAPHSFIFSLIYETDFDSFIVFIIRYPCSSLLCPGKYNQQEWETKSQEFSILYSHAICLVLEQENWENTFLYVLFSNHQPLNSPLAHYSLSMCLTLTEIFESQNRTIMKKGNFSIYLNYRGVAPIEIVQ